MLALLPHRSRLRLCRVGTINDSSSFDIHGTKLSAGPNWICWGCRTINSLVLMPQRIRINSQCKAKHCAVSMQRHEWPALWVILENGLIRFAAPDGIRIILPGATHRPLIYCDEISTHGHFTGRCNWFESRRALPGAFVLHILEWLL